MRRGSSKRATVADMRGAPTLRSGLVSGSGPNLEDCEACELIGEGQYGVVHTVREKLTGQSRVVKTVTRPATWDEGQLKMEAEILQNLDHPHILRVFSWYEDGDCINIVMEHCQGGELLKIVRAARAKGEDLSELWAATGLRQVFEALVYIHGKGVVHKDLKGENLMLLQSTEGPMGTYNSLPHMIVCDLGLAEVCGRGIFGGVDRLRHVAGTPGTMAPEVWKGSFGPKCDVWSMGCVMFELFAGFLPYRPKENLEPLWFEEYRKGPEWSLMDKWSITCIDLCRALLVIKESRRLTAGEALEMPWIKERSAKTVFSQDDALALCNAVALWRERNPMQRALCLKMAAGATCLKKLAGFFSSFDDDNSGVLESAEIVPMLTSIGIDEDVAKDTANALDVNGDGSCEYIEFAAACLSTLEERYDELLRAEFLMLDTRCEGELDRDQMDILIKELEPLAAAHGLELQDIDENGDGSIDFEEFCAYFGRPGIAYKRMVSGQKAETSTMPMKEQIRILPDADALEEFRRSTMISIQRSSNDKASNKKPAAKRNSKKVAKPKPKRKASLDAESELDESSASDSEPAVSRTNSAKRNSSKASPPKDRKVVDRKSSPAADAEVVDRMLARMLAASLTGRRPPAPPAARPGTAAKGTVAGAGGAEAAAPCSAQLCTAQPAASQACLGPPLGERLSHVSSSEVPKPAALPEPVAPLAPDPVVSTNSPPVVRFSNGHITHGQSWSMEMHSTEFTAKASCAGCDALFSSNPRPRKAASWGAAASWGVCSL